MLGGRFIGRLDGAFKLELRAEGEFEYNRADESDRGQTLINGGMGKIRGRQAVAIHMFQTNYLYYKKRYGKNNCKMHQWLIHQYQKFAKQNRWAGSFDA